MELKNPQTWQYGHANFGANKLEVSLNDVPTDEATLRLDVKAPDGRLGSANIKLENNGNVIVRVHLDAANPIHVLIVDGSGTLFEG